MEQLLPRHTKNEWSAAKEARKVGIVFGAIGEEALKKYGYFGPKEAKVLVMYTSSTGHGVENGTQKRSFTTGIFFGPFDVFYSNLLRLVEDYDYSDYTEEML